MFCSWKRFSMLLYYLRLPRAWCKYCESSRMILSATCLPFCGATVRRSARLRRKQRGLSSSSCCAASEGGREGRTTHICTGVGIMECYQHSRCLVQCPQQRDPGALTPDKQPRSRPPGINERAQTRYCRFLSK